MVWSTRELGEFTLRNMLRHEGEAMATGDQKYSEIPDETLEQITGHKITGAWLDEFGGIPAEAFERLRIVLDEAEVPQEGRRMVIAVSPWETDGEAVARVHRAFREAEYHRIMGDE